MSIVEKLLWYWNEYDKLISLSLFYFATLPIVGYFIILRRSLFFGLALTNLAQFSFVLGFSIFALYHGDAFAILNRNTANSSHQEVNLISNLLKLDLYVWPIFLCGLFALILLMRKIKSVTERTDLLLVTIFIVLSGVTHVSHKLFGATELIISKAYFTEILYTSPDLLQYYLFFLLPLLFLLLLFFERFLAISFDAVQASLNGLSLRFYTIFFYLISGALIAIHLRVLGFYLSLTVLFIPPFIALSLFHQVFKSLLFSSLFSLLFALVGFNIAFLWDELPTEPLLIISFGLQSILVYLLVRLVFQKRGHFT